MATPVEPDPRRSVGLVKAGWVVVAAGVGGFVAGGTLCLPACYGLLYLYASGLPRRAEVNDALADVPVAFGGVCFALVLSLAAATVSGMWAAGWASRRCPGEPAEPGAAAGPAGHGR
jgi:hypothetical protein